ncbi:MAG: hypothetical protein O7D32_01405 [bacterium]|nr:hypothetical protein [bacterium]
MRHEPHILRTLIGVCGALFLAGCGGPATFRMPEPIPDDRRDIPEPAYQKIYILADGYDKQVTKPIVRAFDLSRQFRRLFNQPKEAFNTNAFDEVDDSSWFTNRNAKKRLTLDDIRRGPDTVDGPNVDSKWTVVGAKTEGVTPGFTIKDEDGVRYVIKFDPPDYPELATGAEMVSTKLFWAAGYSTPENYLVYFDPANLVMGNDVKLKDKTGKKRAMTREDLDYIIDVLQKRPDGTVRAVASKFLVGKIVGPFRYYTTRDDDPNDFIPHEHRRELRGLRLISAWLNHFDTKANNSLDVYVEEDGKRFVRHYLIDFGSTLGSEGDEPMTFWRGHETHVDSWVMLKNTLMLGARIPEYQYDVDIEYPEIGRIKYHDFNPETYKFIIPNPAFVNMTHRDAFWGTKVVMSFTDEQIDAAVEAGGYTNPDAAAFLADVIKKRRDIVGREYFGKMNSVDRFSVSTGSDGSAKLTFVDLAVATGVSEAKDKRYEYRIFRDGKTIGEVTALTHGDAIPLPSIEDGILDVRVRDMKTDGKWANWVSAYVELRPNGTYKLIGIKRHD